ncbi:helix-turn-helix domain-containing protein [Paenibacillus sp. NPDC057967]|uniref:helix-turn-helix domain-containing protein n=1 Tax=Paenibacillus sp. NPDC057967 TaxID=3346293 RepID=UPI0036D97A40
MISERINVVINKRSIQQKDLAAAIDVLPQTFNGYMSGRREFPVDVVVKVAKYLNVSADFLLGLSDEVDFD